MIFIFIFETVLNLTKSAFIDVYGTNPDVTIENNEYSEVQKVMEKTGAYVHDCVFSYCTSETAGGALLCTVVDKLYIEQTTFYSCKTYSKSGGAIYAMHYFGQCAMIGIC